MKFFLLLKRKVISFPFYLIKKIYLIVSEIKFYIIWPLFKPKKIYYEDKYFYTSLKEYTLPSRNLFSYNKMYDEFEKDLVFQKVNKNDVCIDIGANIGFYSYLFLKKVKSGGFVFAFESAPEICKILKKNFQYYDNFYCINQSVDASFNVKNFSNILKRKVNFIKIDIDGADYYALKSFKKIIETDKPKLLIELAEQSEREHDIHYSEVINFLKKYNYQIFEVDKNLKQFNRDLKFNEIINIFAY